jgi:hypothetical protein
MLSSVALPINIVKYKGGNEIIENIEMKVLVQNAVVK